MKKTIVVLVIFLLLLILITFFINGFLKKDQLKKPTPNLQYDYQTKKESLQPTITAADKNNQIENIKKTLPFKTGDFELDYSSSSDKFIVKEKTPQAKEKFQTWAKMNKIDVVMKENPNLFTFSNDLKGDGKNITPTQKTSVSPTPFSNTGVEILVDLLKILLSLNSGFTPTSSTGSSNVTNTPTNILISPSVSPTLIAATPIIRNGLVHYRQKDGPYDYYPLTGASCFLKDAGCGPTTVAMILSSKINLSYTPPRVVDIYKSNGYILDCDRGSSYVHARELMSRLGVKTTNFIFASQVPLPIENVAAEMRNYIKAGWTLFALANYMTSKGEMGHYFWIINIDQNNNVWAYDGYYGRFQIPFNENAYYPYPRYKLAFGVK